MLYTSNAFQEIVRIWADISLKSPSTERTVIVPAERITHAFRREIVANPDWRNLLIGTRFMRPVRFAADIMLLAGKPARPGAEDVEPVMLEELFDGPALQGKLKYFDIEQLRTGAGFADAFARTFDDLRAAGVDSAALRAAAKSATDQISRGRFLDLATVLDAFHHPYADRHKILRDAAKIVTRPAQHVFACLVREPEESELEFLSSLPNINAAILTANPRYSEDDARLEQMARRLGGLAPGNPQTQDPGKTEISILKRHLFSDPEELAQAGRPVSKGADGTVQTELHAGVAEEIDAAVDWVSDRIVAGVPLERIAVIVPDSDPLSGMLYSRLARLPWPESDIPVHVAGGLPVIDMPFGRRMLALIDALHTGLRVDEFFHVLPFLKFDKPVGKFARRHLSLAESRDILWVCGTLGGSPVRPEGAAEWTPGFERRITHMEKYVGLKEVPDGRQHDVRNADRYYDVMKAVLPAVRALVDLAMPVSREEPLGRIWSVMKSFWEKYVIVFDDSDSMGDLDESLDPFLSLDRKGYDALTVIRRRLETIRRSVGRFGEANIFIGTPDRAAGIPFDAVRVMGLAEGAVGAAASDDPLLPDTDRMLLGRPIRLSAHLPRVSVQNIHRIVNHARTHVSFSAPRQTIDGTVHEPSSLFLDIAAALRRPNAETKTFDPKYLRASSVRRDYFAPGMASRAEYFKMVVSSPASNDIGKFLDADASTRPGPLDGFLRVNISKPEKLSASSLGTLLTCPHKFLYEKLLGWAEPPTLPETNALDALAYGKLFHAVMESFFSRNAESFYAHRQTLDKWLRAAQEEGHRQFEELIRFYPLVGKDFRLAQRERLDGDIDSVIRYEWQREPQVRVAGIEESFGVDKALELGGLPFKGYIDRVDVVGGKSLIRDFKTGRSHVRKENEPPDPVMDAQLAVYSLALIKLAKGKNIPPPAGAEYFYPRGAASRAFLGEDFGTLLKHGRDWLSLAAGLLDESSFPRTPDKEDCRYCAFKPVCGENFALIETKMKSAGRSAEKYLFLKKPPNADGPEDDSKPPAARNVSAAKKRVTKRAG